MQNQEQSAVRRFQPQAIELLNALVKTENEFVENFIKTTECNDALTIFELILSGLIVRMTELTAVMQVDAGYKAEKVLRLCFEQAKGQLPALLKKVEETSKLKKERSDA